MRYSICKIYIIQGNIHILHTCIKYLQNFAHIY